MVKNIVHVITPASLLVELFLVINKLIYNLRNLFSSIIFIDTYYF